MKKKLSLLSIFLLLICVGLTGCKKDENNSDTKNVKVTFSVSPSFNKAKGDDFSLSVSGAVITNSSSRFIDWKVNGANNVGTLVTVDSDYVNGGKSNVIVESAEPISKETGSVTVTAYCLSGASFTVTYKVEVAGKIIDQQTIEVKSTNANPIFKAYNF